MNSKRSPGGLSPVSVKKHSSGKSCTLEYQLSEHQIRGWRAVSAAGLQGNGSEIRARKARTERSELDEGFQTVSSPLPVQVIVLIIIIIIIMIMIRRIITIIVVVVILIIIIINSSSSSSSSSSSNSSSSSSSNDNNNNNDNNRRLRGTPLRRVLQLWYLFAASNSQTFCTLLLRVYIYIYIYTYIYTHI